MRITITARYVRNPKQGWSGWIARVGRSYQGGPHASWCDAIDIAHRVTLASAPAGARIECRDPSEKARAAALEA